MDEVLKPRRGGARRRWIVGAAALLAGWAPAAVAESVGVQEISVGEARGEAGPTLMLQFSFAEALYRSLNTPDWKWVSNSMGYDAAAFGASTGMAVIGVRVEKLADGKGGVLEKMGAPAIAAIRKKWADEEAGERVKVLAFEASPENEEVAVRFRRMEKGRELEGFERSFFGEGRLITLGMLADARHLETAWAMFSHVNGSFAKVEP
ncbi:MAG: hypothetical protein IT578_01085 [Verrucomicrobiae bacterium]|nr:hypothetical protein [Verrucomicrobiae bacterium]